MLSEDVCPVCESSHTEFIYRDSDVMGDTICIFRCKSCGCRYRAKFVEVLVDVEVEEDDE